MADALNPELITRLRVASAAPAADGIRRFELTSPDGAPLAEFSPGAHLLLQAPNGMTRRYSISNPPAERQHYVIAVKREAHGRGGSASMVDEIRAGDLLHASLPRNEFALKASAGGYLFVAGGIGITPIRSMVHHVAATGDAPFELYYLSRDPGSTAFRDDFGALPARGKVVVHHDHGDPQRSLDLWPVFEKPRAAQIYCCGPPALMEAVRDMTGHWPTSAVHFEDFGTRNVARAAGDTSFTVRLGAAGAAIDVPAGVSILEALRACGHRIPSSCESGTCGSCRVKLLAGEADHRDLVLAESERRHAIMVCVSRARSPELVLEP